MLTNPVVLDVESYPNFTLFAFQILGSGKRLTISMRGKNAVLSKSQRRKLFNVMTKRVTFGFNSRNYDMLIILLALKGKTAQELFDATNVIIGGNLAQWMSLKHFDLSYPRNMKHYDIKEVAPSVMVSLKLYGGRLHSKEIRDLPYEVGKILTKHEMNETIDYCGNDLETTIDLHNEVFERLELRVKMSKQYGLDLMSKSDAQIAEAVIKSELKKRGVPYQRLKAPKLAANSKFKYKAPKYIKFKTDQLRDALHVVNTTKFTLSAKGSIQMPPEVNNLRITMGRSTYKMGLGGLHSQESAQTIIPKKGQLLIDKDVASYYPSIIMNVGVIPKHLGPKFLEVYSDILETRIEAKNNIKKYKGTDKEANFKNISDSLKITLNGTFGKLGSRFSVMYSPENMIAVTITGQLAILMLIERLYIKGFDVVSSNTDGFVTLLKKKRYKEYEKICKKWEKDTGLVLEETRYTALYSRDVNNYIAMSKGYVKKKGIFVTDSVQKNPKSAVSVDAVIAYLEKGKSPRKTVRKCKDVKRFINVKKVAGGGVYQDQFLGRVARWVYVKDGDKITYASNGNKVGGSDGSRPMMKLGKIPKDIDYNKYERDALDMIAGLGIKDDILAQNL